MILDLLAMSPAQLTQLAQWSAGWYAGGRAAATEDDRYRGDVTFNALTAEVERYGRKLSTLWEQCPGLPARLAVVDRTLTYWESAPAVLYSAVLSVRALSALLDYARTRIAVGDVATAERLADELAATAVGGQVSARLAELVTLIQVPAA